MNPGKELFRSHCRETGAVYKKWDGRISAALIFPDSYAIGAANLGLQTVYSLLNQYDHIVCERFFAPEFSRTGSGLRNPCRRSGRWVSMESGRRIAEFDLVLFSISFESNYTDVLIALNDGGLTLSSRKRIDSEPLVIAGGVAVQINPEPVADFIDAFLLGDFETISGRLVSELPVLADSGITRQKRLQRLAKNVPGCYVPGACRPIYDRSGELVSWDVDPAFPFPAPPSVYEGPTEIVPHTRILSPFAAFPNMFMLELARGCGRGCRFCAAGFVYRPPRKWPVESLKNTIARRNGTDRIGLVGLEFLGRDHTESLCQEMLAQGLKLRFSSMRADGITGTFVRLLGKSGQRSVTMAPEAGSERLRRAVNKNLRETTILTAAELLASAGIPDLKLYFMIGLPFETEDDVQEIVALVDRIRRTVRPIGRSRGHLGSITVSVNTFVPKAWTPFQWAATADPAVLRKKRKILIRGLGRLPNTKLKLDSAREAIFQAVLSRGDRRLAPALELVAIHGVLWKKALKETGLSADMYCGMRGKETLFTWEVVGHRVRKEYLWREWERASMQQETGFCHTDVCTRCGVCGVERGL